MKKLLLLLLFPLSLFGQGTKISDMTSATSLTGAEYVPIVQTTNKKATVSLLRGWSSIGTASQLLRVNAGATALEFFTPTWLTNPLTTTGDIIYSSSGTTGARLGIGGAGSFLRSDGSIPAWSTLTIPNTISALSIPVVNTANVLTSVTPAAGQSVRINAGGTAWEAYTPSTSSDVLTTSVSVTSGELLNIYTSAKQLLAAPGSGLAYQILSIGFSYVYSTAAYATDTNLVIQYSTVSFFGTFGGIINQTSDKVLFPVVVQVGVTDTANLANQAVFLTTASANPTAGGGSLKVYLTYKIVTL